MIIYLLRFANAHKQQYRPRGHRTATKRPRIGNDRNNDCGICKVSNEAIQPYAFARDIISFCATPFQFMSLSRYCHTDAHRTFSFLLYSLATFLLLLLLLPLMVDYCLAIVSIRNRCEMWEQCFSMAYNGRRTPLQQQQKWQSHDKRYRCICASCPIPIRTRPP